MKPKERLKKIKEDYIDNDYKWGFEKGYLLALEDVKEFVEREYKLDPQGLFYKLLEELEVINNSDVCIVSRVGDEGLSIPSIQRVIEIDFLFGSRRQEGQRLGRLFHGEEKGEHIILMTEKEFEEFCENSGGFKIW